jgi:hypothetical protein
MDVRAYAGIGSRETPDDVLILFRRLGAHLGKLNFLLRSGAAEGADKAFEFGCDMVKGAKEIYLPWRGFGKSDSNLIVHDDRAYDIAKKFHPNFDRLSDAAMKLQARNSHQVLGFDLKDPVQFVICWTPRGFGSGGTGQAIRIAKSIDIPVFDAGRYSMHRMPDELKRFLLPFGGV